MRRLERRDRIQVGEGRSESVNGASRVAAAVDGITTWFESADVPLEPVTEAWTSAFLIPALHRHAVLESDATVDPAWLEHVPAIESLLHEWWKLPRKTPRLAAHAPRSTPEGGERVLFFSGGVDSFYTLLCSGSAVDGLVLLHGFDYARDDKPRLEATERTLREVAAARGLRRIVVRTNAREHPLFEHVDWERTHGGVLAATAHVLGGGVRDVLISSSVNQVTPQPWGSHWLLDPLWSSSRRAVVHVGQEKRKEDKIRAIAGEPLAHRFLRVCWENRSASGNCSRCYKCLYARLVLADLGALDRFEVFEGTDTLAAGLDALPRGRNRMRTFLAMQESPRLPADVRRALVALIERTQRDRHPIARLRRTAADAVFGLLPRRPR